MPVTFETAMGTVFLVILVVSIVCTVIDNIWRREHDDLGKGGGVR